MKRAALIALFALAAGCEGAPSHTGLEEPLRAPGAFFLEGPLPGIPQSELPEDPGELEALTPRVPVLSPSAATVRPGQAGVGLSGTTTEDAYSIGVRLRDVSSGYWVRAVGALTGIPNEREWDVRLDFSPNIEPGPHVLEVVAFDAEGNAGPQTSFGLCLTRAAEHSRNACDPTVLPPAALISLSWESDADVDLVVVTPRGVIVDATQPTTLDASSGSTIDREAPGMGLLSVDGNGACRRDGVRRETLSWPTSPERGEHLVYAKLFQPCGADATHFKVESFVRTAGEDEGTYGFERFSETRHGTLLAPHVNGDADFGFIGSSASGDRDLGLFVTTIDFP
jgi:hypothetical protein